MVRRQRERYLTRDQAETLCPLLLAVVAKVTKRMMNGRAVYRGSKRDNEVLLACSHAFRTDMNQGIREMLALRTRKYLP